MGCSFQARWWWSKLLHHALKRARIINISSTCTSSLDLLGGLAGRYSLIQDTRSEVTVKVKPDQKALRRKTNCCILQSLVCKVKSLKRQTRKAIRQARTHKHTDTHTDEQMVHGKMIIRACGFSSVIKGIVIVFCFSASTHFELSEIRVQNTIPISTPSN